MRLALFGATGMVGRVMLQVLEERNIVAETLIPVGTERSAGREIQFSGRLFPVVTPEVALKEKPDVALFSAGSALSRELAGRLAAEGCYVIDNSSAWRMDPEVPLVIPEINAHTLQKGKYIIANPNCSTIQLLMAVHPLNEAFGIERMVVSTYQSVTGSGKKAVKQLDDERAGKQADRAYPHQIDLNCLPQCDDFLDNGYTKEEMKLVNESRKILNFPELRVTATAVRVPVKGGHSESVNLKLQKSFSISDIRQVLDAAPGVTVLDDPQSGQYPMPLYSAGKDEVFAGRIRRDESMENSLNMWIVADNLRKGAATNAVQILEELLKIRS